MIFGRPTNLWMGLITALIGLVALIALLVGADPAAVAQLSAALTLVAGSAVTLIANQPPSMNVGQPYTVVTPGDNPNVQKVANSNPTPPAIVVPKNT
jgi:hypothetical protein